MTETLAHGYSSESSQRELSNEYQREQVSMVFEDICVLVIWTKVTTVLIGSVKYAKLIYCFILHKTNIVILVQR